MIQNGADLLVDISQDSCKEEEKSIWNRVSVSMERNSITLFWCLQVRRLEIWSFGRGWYSPGEQGGGWGERCWVVESRRDQGQWCKEWEAGKYQRYFRLLWGFVWICPGSFSASLLPNTLLLSSFSEVTHQAVTCYAMKKQHQCCRWGHLLFQYLFPLCTWSQVMLDFLTSDSTHSPAHELQPWGQLAL